MLMKRFLWIPIVLAASLPLLLLFLERGGMTLPTVPLTPEERAWLAEHPVIRIAPDPGYEPVEFFSGKGVYSGIAADYLSLVQKRTGIRFQVVRLRNREEIFTALRNREVDVLGAATNRRSVPGSCFLPHRTWKYPWSSLRVSAKGI